MCFKMTHIHTRAHTYTLHWYFYPSPEPLSGCKPYHSQTTEEPRSHQLVLKTTILLCVYVCMYPGWSTEGECDIKRLKKGGGGREEAKGGKNLGCYQPLPVRPLWMHTQQRPWNCHYMTEPSACTCTATSDRVFPPEASLKQPISAFLVYLWH